MNRVSIVHHIDVAIVANFITEDDIANNVNNVNGADNANNMRKIILSRDDVVRLFGIYSGKMIDIDNLTYGSKNYTFCDNDSIYDRLIDMHRKGYVDDALFMTSVMVLRIPNENIEKADQVLIVCENLGEVPLLKVVARNIIMMSNMKSVEVVEYDELDMQLYLRAFSGDYKLHCFTSLPESLVPEFANFYVSENYHPKSNSPPLGLIPNNKGLCYAASTLTIILSIPQIADRIVEAASKLEIILRNSKRLTSPSVSQSTIAAEYEFLQIMCKYITYLKFNSPSDDDAGVLINLMMLKLPEFEEFSHDSPNDSIEFLSCLIGMLHRANIVSISDTTKTQVLLSKISDPDAPSRDTVLFGMCDIGSCVYSHVEPCSQRSPRSAKLDCTPHEKLVQIPHESGNVPFWTITIENKPYVRTLEEVGSTYGKIIFKTLRDGNQFSIDDIIAHNFNKNNAPLPEILIIRHLLRPNSTEESMMIPCMLIVGNITYSLHGASLYDSVHSNGHYTSVIVSSTTMFIYDPEFNVGTEDMREYRVRYLCYVKV